MNSLAFLDIMSRSFEIAVAVFAMFGFASFCAIGALAIVTIFWRGPTDADRILGDGFNKADR